MTYQRHPQWDEIINALDSIAKHIGSSVPDMRCDKVWDVGQAICAEAYGPDWQNDETFLEWNDKDDIEPPEPHYYSVAMKMAKGYIPEWVED